jgi:hypothetical protein
MILNEKMIVEYFKKAKNIFDEIKRCFFKGGENKNIYFSPLE